MTDDPTLLFNPVGAAGGRKLISQHFGEHPDSYKSWGLQGHNGIDLAVVVGTPVRSAGVTPGVVVVSEPARDPQRQPLGSHVIVEHEPCAAWPDGYQCLYAHMDARQVFGGHKISPGQYLGTSGNTGNSTGPHLHFGLRPLPYDRDDGWRGFVDPVDVISWDRDPMPAYVSQYNPARAQQGLDPLPPVGIDPYSGQASDYGRLSDAQAAQDRAQLAAQTRAPHEAPPARPRSYVKRVTDALEPQDQDSELVVAAKKITGRGGKAVTGGAGLLLLLQLVLALLGPTGGTYELDGLEDLRPLVHGVVDLLNAPPVQSPVPPLEPLPVPEPPLEPLPVPEPPPVSAPTPEPRPDTPLAIQPGVVLAGWQIRVCAVADDTECPALPGTVVWQDLPVRVTGPLGDWYLVLLEQGQTGYVYRTGVQLTQP